MNNKHVLIGLDGGATKISGWEVKYDEIKQVFSMGALHSEVSYKELPGYLPDFKPVEISKQLQERDAGDIRPSLYEQQQEAVYVEACARVVENIFRRSGCSHALIGLGMPGLKTEDRRGIAVVANGPRMIHYSDLLERRLEAAQVPLSAPLHHIGSDADYCGIGENFAEDGLFRDVRNAYYLGGGTGVADALKLNGELVPFDATKTWIAKSWEMKNDDGRSLERFASAGGIQSIYADVSGTPVSVLNEKQIFPMQIAGMAASGEQMAIKTFEMVAMHLARLFFERITTLFAGWQNMFTFVNPNRPNLDNIHPYRGMLFERIIIGQRLGELFESEHGSEFLKKPALTALKALLEKTTILPGTVKEHYGDMDRIMHISRLREAPALGAGIDAYLSSK